MQDGDKIINYLADEESKFIYQKKKEYNEAETGDFAAIGEIVERYLPQLVDAENKVLDLLLNREKIIIFGAGAFGIRALKFLMTHNKSVNSFIDSNSDKWGKSVKGIEIKSPQQIDYNEFDAIIVSPGEHFMVDQIHEFLKKQKFREDTIIIDYKDYCCIELEQEQYFDPDIIKYQENEVFVDAGVLDLGTSIRFIEECEKNNIKNFKILAFEPDYASYQKCLDIQKKYSGYSFQLYNLGLWSESATLYFDEGKGASSQITQKETATSIKTDSLDNCVSEKVTFIKMDIEGAELEALKGSKEIIKKYRPKLAICIYHKKEDLIEIPQFIKDLVPEYKLYIRHYSNTNAQTVLYAVL